MVTPAYNTPLALNEEAILETHLQTLRLLLETLGVPLDTSSIQGRIAMQKAVYLAQALGVPLGYTFSWYVKGPYSKSLADDYYRAAIEGGADETRLFREQVLARLKEVKLLMEPPADLKISRNDWLELLASWHYLRTRAGKGAEEAEQLMRRQKPHLVADVRIAEVQLRQRDLVAA